MFSRIIQIFCVSILISCQNKSDSHEKLISRFKSQFPLIVKDTIKVDANYETLKQLEPVDTNYNVLFTKVNKITSAKDLHFYCRFNIDTAYEGLILVKLNPGNTVSSYLFFSIKNSERLFYFDEISTFRKTNISGTYLTTTITQSKDTLTLNKKFEYCNYIDNPEPGDCRDNTRRQKILVGGLFPKQTE